MQTLESLIDVYGEPDSLIDSYEEDSKRYAIWGFNDVFEVNSRGSFLNNSIIDGNPLALFQKILNEWKLDKKNDLLAAVGFISYEFKNILYHHINFKKTDNDFPFLWFGKPKLIKEYSINIESKERNGALELVNDIIAINKYKQKIDLIKSHLKKGNAYQINFTDKKLFNSSFSNSYQLYDALRSQAKPKEGFFLKNNNFNILSLSPESFIKVKNDIIETLPIKGTRPRSDNKLEDELLKLELKDSLKDKAEHLMIVDLLRNDLGKICQTGSIQVDNLYAIHSFETIHHMVTKITGKLKQKISESDIINALFPGGSITGAPKESAMKIIDSLEPQARNIYTGSAGYICPNGDMAFNICIRTLLQIGDLYEYGVGGGIVWDSIAEEEWDEAQQKSKILNSLIKV